MEDSPTKSCPKCGKKNDIDAIECQRCGIIFEKYEQIQRRKTPGATISQKNGPIFVMNGVQDKLEVFENRLTIQPKGVLGFLNKGIKGKKEILFSSIAAIQIKKAGMLFNGYIQFTIPGGNESKSGIFSAVRDENTFLFHQKDNNNELANKIKEHIYSMLSKNNGGSPTTGKSLTDELEKLMHLKKEGVLSQSEFLAAKKKLIS